MVANCASCGTSLAYDAETEMWDCEGCGEIYERSAIEAELPMDKHRRRDKDDYPTPVPLATWAVQRALSVKGWSWAANNALSVLEPGCGDRAPFASAAAIAGTGIKAIGMDIRKREELPSDAKPAEDRAKEHCISNLEIIRDVDFMDGPDIQAILCGLGLERGVDVIATNPPYGGKSRDLAEQFVRQSLEFIHETGVAVFLLRLSFMATQGRIPLFRDRPPYEVHVLHKRPSFVNGRSDNSEYGFFLWLGSALDEIRKSDNRYYARLQWLDNRDW